MIKRQVKIIMGTISGYKNNSLSLNRLINVLTGTFNILTDSVDNNILDQLENSLFKIEQMYAYSLDMGVRTISEKNKNRVEEELEKITILINEKIKGNYYDEE